MPHHHSLDPTTHTVELDQLHALDAALAAADEARSGPSITAGELGLAGAELSHGSGATLAAEALLLRIGYDGPPEYPYVHGHFTGAGGDAVVELHTAALQALARHLHLQQRWGL